MVEGGDDVCADSGMAMLVAAEFGGGRSEERRVGKECLE